MFENQLKSCLDFIRESLGKAGLKYLKYFIYEKLVEEDIPVIKTKMPVIVRKASKKNIELYTNKNEVLKRLKQGDVCFVAISKNKIAGYLWITFKKRVYIPAIEKTINLMSNEAYIYDVKVFPKFRRNNIGKKILQKEQVRR